MSLQDVNRCFQRFVVSQLSLPVNETKLVHGFYGQYNLCHIESCDVFGKDFVFDEHGHQVTSRQELHEHVQEGVVLERGVQLNDPRAVRFGEDVTFGSYVGKLVFLELWLISFFPCE